jgi:glycosyltransferase involved in cell wall biosynthesis
VRIAVLHNLARGGAWRRLSEQVSRLDADVVELMLGTGTAVTDDPIVVPFSEYATHLPRVARPPLRYADAARLTLAWRHLDKRAMQLNPDVIFTNPCQFRQAPPLSKLRTAPTLYFCDEPRRVDHEPETAATRSPGTRTLYAPLYHYERRLDVVSVQRASSLATNSRYSAGRIRSAYGVDADVVPMGVTDTFLHAALDRPREDIVLSVGMLTAAKGHDLVLHAAAQSSRMRTVTIVSPRPCDSEEQRLRRLASDLGVTLDIRVGVTDEQLRGEYERARVLAYLARGEPFGLAALEAQACGCPVVAADDAGLPEAIVDGMTGYAVARDADAVARAFDLLCEPQASARAQAAAAQHGRAWTWEISARHIRGMLDSLASAR